MDLLKVKQDFSQFQSIVDEVQSCYILIRNNTQMNPNENFGIMDEGYFVPRTEIISWLNDLLKINLTKIEQLGSGAVYCQVVDAIYPGKVSMSKVNWRAKNDYEFIGNYKVLQNAFEKLGVKRYVEVEKLSKAKYQDNLEFIQWLKRYFDVNCSDKGANYPAEERRGSVKIDFGFAEKVVVPKSYNAGGQVIPNKRVASKDKRAESGTSAQKESAKRLASPNVNEKTVSRGKNSSNEKRTSIIEPKESKELIKKPPHPPSHLPPTPSSQKIKVEIKPQTAEETYRPSKASAQELERYKRLVRDLQSKIEMIAEITQAGDDAEIKLKLIEDVLSIGFSKFGKVSDFNPSNIYQDQLRHIDTIKTEEIKQEIANESHYFHGNGKEAPQNSDSNNNSRKYVPSEEEAF